MLSTEFLAETHGEYRVGLQIYVITEQLVVACEHKARVGSARQLTSFRRESTARHGSTQSQRQDPRKHLSLRQEGKKPLYMQRGYVSTFSSL